MMKINLRGHNKISGKSGTYYVYDSVVVDDKTVYELEHEDCGFGVEHLIVDENLNILLETWEGLDEYIRSIENRELDDNAA